MSEDKDVKIKEHQYGVWKFKVAHRPSSTAKERLDKITSSLPLIRHLFLDVLSVSPVFFLLYIVTMIWGRVDSIIMMNLSNTVLQATETGIITGQFDTYRISRAVLFRLVCIVVRPYLGLLCGWVADSFEGRIVRHFRLKILQAKLKMDLETSRTTKGLQGATPEQAWSAVSELVSLVSYMVSATGQLFLIVQISQTSASPLLMLLTISGNIRSLFGGSSVLFFQEALYFAINPDYRRMVALKKFTDDEYRQDVLGGNLGRWIISEMTKAYEALDRVSTSEKHPIHLYIDGEKWTVKERIWLTFTSILGDLPMIYSAYNAWKYPETASLAALAIIQKSASSLTMTMRFFMQTFNRFQTSVDSLKSMYTFGETSPTTRIVGDTHYPAHDANLEGYDSSKGMSLELRNVSFSYPAEKNSTPALKDISFKVSAGQLVVLVGANGSGKSTLIRIIARLCEPSHGELIIDGRPATKYYIEDLHEATALLSQENKIYPFTLAENIGLGYADQIEDEEMILDAAKRGGASKLIDKLKDGLQTSFDPSFELGHYNIFDKPTHPLHREMKELQKEIDVSGGEKQKIVASRTFMRFNTGRVNLVAVDEPSSALDAESELDLFNNLLAVRSGKTMIVVTHRFGHLTKYADMIICMKDGSIAEQGTHAQLMENQGEYANLYTIQAQAFSG